MKLNLFLKLLIGTSIWFTTSVFADEAWQVTSKAWEALAKNDFNTVERLANESVRKWGEQARKRNNELFRLPSAKEAKKYNTLNELATIVWLKGEALLKKGDRDGALAAYYTVIADYEFGQTWDNKGWYWSPAATSRDRIAELSPSSKSELSLITGSVTHCFTITRKERDLFYAKGKRKERKLDSESS